MGKNIVKVILVSALACVTFPVTAQQGVTVKGKVKFADDDFKVQVFQLEGTAKKILAEAPVGSDGTYRIELAVDKPGEAVVDCGRWQSVNVWLEDENLDIDFRGLDTAKVKIKNPPYVYIRGGRKNELMNIVNFVGYRSYQSMIAIGRSVWRAGIEDSNKSSALSMALYDYSGDNNSAWMRYLVEHYSDLSSVLVPISRLNADENADVIEPALDRLERQSAAAGNLVAEYRKAAAESKERRGRMKEGNPAPDFSFQTEKGGKQSLSEYKGKVLLLDFWASWCGPCRQEIPGMKQYYEEYRDKGVEFLSVSIDAKREAWTKAVSDEGMTWRQGWVTDAGKSVMDTYQFGGIPFIILVDKDGNIYRKNLRGEQIKKAIDDCLSGKAAKQPKTVGGLGMTGASGM